MALSNTAVPRYYGIFRDAVIRGEVPVNQEVALEMERIDKWIADPAIYYDDEAVEGWIKFCEREMTLTDGTDMVMLDTFKLWGEQLFGWYEFIPVQSYIPGNEVSKGRYYTHFEKRRMINKQYLIIGRGAAKSVYEADIQAFILNVDGTTTKQVTVAPTMKQAEEVMSTIRTAIVRSRGPLFKFLTAGSLQNTTGNKFERQKLASTKKGIENFLTGSLLEIRPMSIDKLQGLRTKVATVDEWLSGDVREDVVGCLEQGSSKVDDWIILAVSSEGCVRNGIGDSIKMELSKILRGEYVDNHTSIWWYKLDSISEVNDPAMWPKANPNIGFTVSYDAYQRDKERAENVPSAKNDILAKRFGIPTEGYTYFFSYNDTIPHPTKSFYGMPCSVGADLSQGDDFCSFGFLFPLGPSTFGVKTRNYITDLTYNTLHPSLRDKYDQFIAEDSLVVLPGAVLDIMMVYDELDRYIMANQYDCRSFGYDPYNAKEFVERWAKENGPFNITKVIQGYKTESVPLGELQHLASQRLLIFDQKLFSFTMGNCIALEDTNGNRKLYKRRREEKIDAVASLMDAYIAYKINVEAFE